MVKAPIRQTPPRMISVPSEGNIDGTTNPDMIGAQMTTDSKTSRTIADSSKQGGLTNPMESCIRNGGLDVYVKGQSQNDLKAPRLPQRLHEHPDSSRMHTGGDQLKIKPKVTKDVRVDGQLRSHMHASEFAYDV